MVCDMLASPVRNGFSHSVLPSRSDAARAAHVGRQLTNQQLRAQRGMAQFGMRQPQVIATLGDVIRELVGEAEADTARIARGVDDVNAGNLRLFAAVERESQVRATPHLVPTTQEPSPL